MVSSFWLNTNIDRCSDAINSQLSRVWVRSILLSVVWVTLSLLNNKDKDTLRNPAPNHLRQQLDVYQKISKRPEMLFYSCWCEAFFFPFPPFFPTSSFTTGTSTPSFSQFGCPPFPHGWGWWHTLWSFDGFWIDRLPHLLFSSLPLTCRTLHISGFIIALCPPHFGILWYNILCLLNLII